MIRASSLVLFLNLAIVATAQIPATLSYQGLLTDNTGVPVSDGNHSILFDFYTTSTGGTPDFTRGPITVTSFKGLFTMILGNGQGSNNAALPVTLGDTQYYVGIEADGQSELVPRVMLTAVPYAFRAETVNTVNADNISAGTIADARLSTHLQDLADGTLSGDKVGSGFDAANITKGTINPARIPETVGVPIGTIIAYGGETIPTGWLLCDGQAYNQADYAALFAAIGSNWGAGSSTFNVPDLRGMFLRGVDHGAGNDPDALSRMSLLTLGATGDNVGSYQDDEFRSHDHPRRPDGSKEASIPNSSGNLFDHDASGGLLRVNGIVDLTVGGVRGGNETRPKNAFVNFIIKAE